MTRRTFAQLAGTGFLAATHGKSGTESGVLRMYLSRAKLDGATAPDSPKVNTVWTGPGSATWTVDVPQAEEYEVAVCYACSAAGTRLLLGAGKAATETTTRTTIGFYSDAANNYERVHMGGSLRLPAGRTKLALRVFAPQGKPTLWLRSIELTPVSAKPRLEAEEQRALEARASTDWFVKSGYGVMFHWTGQSKPRHGPAKSYADAVRSFPVRSFVETIQETGAGHVILTVNHAIAHCPAPIASWEKYHPGLTTSRDLLGELADGLARAQIRFLLYINSPGLGKIGAGPPGFTQDQRGSQYVDMHCEILDEIGRRYGRKVAGYWFDSWYQSFERFPNVQQERIFQACKIGNPDRISAFNFWVLPVCTPWQEYWAGEVGSPGPPATSRYIRQGAGAGLQFQSLLFLDAPWVHAAPDTEMEPPRFSGEALTDYVRACMQNQGVVTVNLGIYQDGMIGPQAREIMRSVRRPIRGS